MSKFKQMKNIFLVLMLGVSLIACSSDSEKEITFTDPEDKNNNSKDTTNVDIEIGETNAYVYLEPIGDKIEWGYDIKQHNVVKSFTPEFAEEIYSEDRMALLRISLLPNEHNEDGSVIKGATRYTEAMQAIKIALNAKPDVIIFASLKLNGFLIDGEHQTFPEWAREEGSQAVIPDEYIKMIKGFFRYMKDNEVNIHYFGVDNELVFNKADISPQDYYYIVSEIKSWINSQNNIDMPLFIAPEDYGPRAKWLEGLLSIDPNKETVDLVGTHYYPAWRPFKDLKALATVDISLPFWNSEVHWDKLTDEDIANGKDYIDWFELQLATTFEFFDLNGSVMTWWGYSRNKSGHRLMVTSTASYNRVKAIYGNSNTDSSIPVKIPLNELLVRAFKDENNRISVWISNNTNQNFDNFTIELDGKKPKGDIIQAKWDSGWDGISSPILTKAQGKDNYVVIKLLPRTISLVQFEIEE